MSIGIGGAGSKLASLLDNGRSTIVNVSGLELDKVPAAQKIAAVLHTYRGQLRGAHKDPAVGREAFPSIREELLAATRGTMLFSSTGGGTGNGITSVILEVLSAQPTVPAIDRTMFVFVLPYPEREASEFVDNTIDFLSGPVSMAIDTGNTGNIMLMSNRLKFQQRIAEAECNRMMIESLRQFLAIPEKGERFKLLDGHIDYEDFAIYCAKPYFNHFAQFTFRPETPFAEQLAKHRNPLLLPPAETIEAMFLLELPDPAQAACFYAILDHFAEENVAPNYGVVHNPDLAEPQLTVSLLYSRKPLELVSDFTQISEHQRRTRIRKSIDQHVTLPRLAVDLSAEAKQVHGDRDDEILDVLKRLGKL